MGAETNIEDVEETPVAPDDELLQDDELASFTDDEWSDLDSDVPWHAVLAPLNVLSGDRRKITDVEFREFPLPLRHMDADFGGHDGAVPVSAISRAWVDEGLVRAEGTFSGDSEVVGRAISQIVSGEQRGVSVDIDSAEMSMENEDGSPFNAETWTEGDPEPILSGKGRISAATLCAIPAFQEAYIALGPYVAATADQEMSGRCLPCEALAAIETLSEQDAKDFGALLDAGSERAPMPPLWASADGQRTYSFVDGIHVYDGTSVKTFAGFPPEEEDAGGEYPDWEVGDTVKVDAPSGEEVVAVITAIDDATGTATVEAEGGGTFDVHLADLRPYTEPEDKADGDDDSGDGFAVSKMETFAPGTHDGPGWVTNPKETQRLRTYWTKGKGAAKIRWGQGGDFNRCRRQLAKYVQNPAYLAGTCANLHKVALGFWPSTHKAMVASAGTPGFTLATTAEAPVLPASWFLDPELPGPTPLTVTEEGRVFGHLATWGTCHISPQYGNECVTPPSSPSNYAYYRTGAVLTDQGQMPVGSITMHTGHAGETASARVAMAHYDNTGAVVADVASGDDDHGIWVAGAMRRDVTADDVVALRAAALSGDWRKIGGQYELVAALAVNVPGFPIPRTSLAASGEMGQESLVAAGVVRQHADAIVSEVPMIPATEIAGIVRASVAEYIAEGERKTRVAALAPFAQKARAHRLSKITAKFGGN
jgi:hypothetical protein